MISVESDLDASFGDPHDLVQNINQVGKTLLQNQCNDPLEPLNNKPPWPRYVYPPLSRRNKYGTPNSVSHVLVFIFKIQIAFCYTNIFTCTVRS